LRRTDGFSLSARIRHPRARISSLSSPRGGGRGYLDNATIERRRGTSVYTTAAALSLSAGIAGWLFLITTWGFSSLVAPFGLVAAVAGVWSPKKLVAGFGFMLNALLLVVLVDWWPIVDLLPGFPTD
jgi:hypothetical protein